MPPPPPSFTLGKQQLTTGRLHLHLPRLQINTRHRKKPNRTQTKRGGWLCSTKYLQDIFRLQQRYLFGMIRGQQAIYAALCPQQTVMCRLLPNIPHSTVFQPLVNRANSWYYQIYKIVMISSIILKCYIQQKNTSCKQYRYKNVLRSPNIISPKVQMHIKLIMCSKTEKLSQIRSFNQKGQFSPKKTECWFNFVNLVMEFCYNCWKMKVLQALTLLLEF